MKTFQSCLKTKTDLRNLKIPFSPDLLLVFVSPKFPGIDSAIEKLSQNYPKAILFGCSTSGEILKDQVLDDSIALTAVKFKNTKIKSKTLDLASFDGDSRKAGSALFEALQANKLKHLLILSDGLKVNGAELAHGLQLKNHQNISITGGLAGDGDRFEKTFVIDREGVHDNRVIGLGFYGDTIKASFGTKGGWDSFGMEREVTHSHKNVVYKIDGKPALELYKSYLGDKVKELPSSALLFPLSMRTSQEKDPLVRTILSINEEDNSMTFAGDIPEGSFVRMMKANVDRLIDGAEKSAELCLPNTGSQEGISILISCVGRRLVLKQLIEEEVEAVNDILPQNFASTGFYSYGEIAPLEVNSPCELHNQTMTITTITE